ncbi:MAG: DsbE family thiol:disulfide interchange protein [Alphaproteobacteria bacterium]|nr:DsbE family thiol:disulfide interchange protein [Alphaproteobacteria bacterium]
MNRRLLFLLPVLVFAGLAGAFWVGRPRDPRRVPSALIDKPVPSFALAPLIDGKPGLATADLATGKPALVNFFASWCGPCRVEHPILMRLQRDGVALQGIAWKDAPDDARKFLRDLGDPFQRVGIDRDNRAGIDWGVYGVPETYVVDGKGVIRFRHAGPLTPEIVRDVVMPLLAGGKP